MIRKGHRKPVAHVGDIINDQGKKVTVVDPEVKQNIQQTLMLQIFLKYDHLAGPPEVRK